MSPPVTSTTGEPGTTGGSAAVDSGGTTTSGATDDTAGTADSGTTGAGERCVGDPLTFTWSQINAVPVGANPQSIGGADLDSDGTLDLVVGDYDTQQVGVWLGSGDGTFSMLGAVPASGNPISIQLGDIADGIPDLFVRYYDGFNFDYRITRWRGGGDGTFQLASQLGPAGNFDLGHFDGDGYLDLAYLAATTMSVRFGNVSEMFSSASATSVPGSARAVDLDGDGADDLITVAPPMVAAYLNDGSGSFSAAGTAALMAPIGGMAFGDVDGDGNVDVVTGAFGGGNTFASVFLGDGSGGIGASIDHTVPEYTAGVIIADIDADGIADPLLLGTGVLMFLHSNGDGTVENAVVTPVETCNNVGGFVLGDFNDDCVPDPVVLCLDDDAARVFLSSL